MMNIVEQKAMRWILKQGYSENDIVFRAHDTPDFIIKDGKTFEAKKVYGTNKVWMYSNQLKKLSDAEATILVFDNEDEPKIIISAKGLKDGDIHNGIIFTELHNRINAGMQIVINGLTKEEMHELRVFKISLYERSWRSLLLRVMKEWKEKGAKGEYEQE